MKVLTVFGTRPEAIKLAPILIQLEKARPQVESVVCVTGQHREMLDQTLAMFGIHPNYDLEIMTEGQSLFDISTRTLTGLRPILERETPDIVMVQGDTTSACFAAIAAFYLKIAVAHVEAGLRTGDRYDPFPEEMNRTIIGQVADIHFAPTEDARANLRAAGIAEERIHVTGNPIVDAVHYLTNRAVRLPREIGSRLPRHDGERLIVVTTHRRESFGAPMRGVLQALADVIEHRPETRIVFPVHLNPNVRRAVQDTLSGGSRVLLTDPLPYDQFLYIAKQAYLLVTDSGGIQEEAAALGKPVLVVRNTTERMESVRTGTSKLVGRRRADVAAAIESLLDDPAEYQRMAAAPCPYGDGHAAERIVDILCAVRARRAKVLPDA